MQWQDLLGHQQQREWFQRALSRGRLASSFLFIGPEGIGKRAFALLLAKGMLCRQSSPTDIDFCDDCEDCAQVDASTHPDLIQVSKPEDRASIPLELLIGEGPNRNREGLCHELSMKPYGGRRKIAILDDADYLNEEGANCLLKTLEEPPPRSVLILIGTSLQRQLPTIRSRCQAILFRPLLPEHIARLLTDNGVVESPAEADLIASLSQGSLHVARNMADPHLHEFRKALWKVLAQRPLRLTGIIKECQGIVEQAGKEARLRRDRMKLVLNMAAEFYRAVLLVAERDGEGGGLIGNDELRRFALQAIESLRLGRRDALRCWNRCLQAIEQVDRNANQQTLIEACFCDLAVMGRS